MAHGIISLKAMVQKSQCAQFFRRAHFVKRRALYGPFLDTNTALDGRTDRLNFSFETFIEKVQVAKEIPI